MIKFFRSRLLPRFLLVTGVLLGLAACNGKGVYSPQVASPPPFDYADGAELRSRMHQLAYELQRLDRILAGEKDNDENIQKSVVENLRTIERIAKSLQAGDLSSKHSFLMDDMDSFLDYVSKAQWQAARKTPRYYMAGRLTGACISCHKAQY